MSKVSTVIQKQLIGTFNKSLDDVWHVFSQMGSVLESMGLERFVVARREKGKLARDTFLDDGTAEKNKIFMSGYPIEWVKYQFIQVQRTYLYKPYTTWKLRVSFEQTPYDSIQVIFDIEAELKSSLSKPKALKEINAQIDKIASMFEGVQTYFEGDRSHPFPRKPVQYDEQKVNHQMLQVEKSSYGHGLTRRLVNLAFNGLESEITNIRPHHIAKRWERSTAHVTEVLMYASKVGLLTYNWYMSCPTCGHMQPPIPSLDRMPKSGECVACGASFTRDFSKNVEMVFRPHPEHRVVPEGTYCYMNPSRRRRTLVHLYLKAGERLELNVPWPEGEAINCTIEQTNEEILINETKPRPLHIRAANNGVFEELTSETEKTVILNERDEPIILAIRMPYAHQMRYTGMEAITSHAFRELCKDDLLERSDEIPLANITVMFTDLKSSTAMYEAIGDLKAYHMVRDHFEMMSDVIRYHGGALVKTIGDAIMAVFMHPKDAVEAGIAIQNDVKSFNEKHREKEHAVIKMGIHSGPCVSVLMNNRMDFFGQMINTASRLQNYSEGDDIVISLPVAADLAVSKLLRPYEAESHSVDVKGLDEPIQILRLKSVNGFFEEELSEE